MASFGLTRCVSRWASTHGAGWAPAGGQAGQAGARSAERPAGRPRGCGQVSRRRTWRPTGVADGGASGHGVGGAADMGKPGGSTWRCLVLRLHGNARPLNLPRPAEAAYGPPKLLQPGRTGRRTACRLLPVRGCLTKVFGVRPADARACLGPLSALRGFGRTQHGERGSVPAAPALGQPRSRPGMAGC